ncbi:MAG: hypothetical protein AB7S39_19510 [Gemmatimonadales bacterium]
MRFIKATLLALAILPTQVRAQGLAAPPGWKWTADGQVRMVNDEQTARESADAMWFVRMPPGFHITMGPGGVLYHPEAGADGRFEVESEIFLFPGTAQGEYGLMLGGRDLGGRAGWTAFVARRDGSAAVLQRRDGETRVAREWQPSSAIVPGRADGTARNVLKVVVGTEVVFTVNGGEVARLPAADLMLDGTIGLRVGAGVNLHVTSLDLLRHLAPARTPRND